MEHAKEVQTLVKKTKLQNAKEMFKLLMAEDPLLTFTIMAVITTFYPTLLTMLAQALLQNNRTQIYLIFQVLIGITIVIMALLFLRGILLNRSLKTKAAITTNENLMYLKKQHEQEKHNQLHKLSNARIDYIQSQTQFIMSLSSDSFRQTIRQNAQTLQQDFTTENIQETIHNVFGTFEKMIIRFNDIDAQYGQAIIQINEICTKLEIKIEDQTIEPLIDPKTSTQGLKNKFDEVLSGIPEPDKPTILTENEVNLNPDSPKDLQLDKVEAMWQCTKCKKEYDHKVRKCKCGRTRPL